MLVVSCGTALGDDEVLKCCYWIEAKVALGDRVVAHFVDAASCAAVEALVAASPLLACLHTANCSTNDDFVVFAALHAASQGATPAELLRFTGDDFESLAVEIHRASHLHRLIWEVGNGLVNGDVDRARSVLGILRSTLATYSGTLSAVTYRRAGDCKVFLDACRDRHYAALRDGSIRVRSKQQQIDVWVEFFPLLDMAAATNALASWTDIAPELQRLRSFVDSGKTSLASDLAALKIGKGPALTVMLWLAAYLVRTSEHYLARGEGAAAIALMVCALDYYIRFRLFEESALAFDSSRMSLQQTSKGQSLFASQRLGEGLMASLMVLAEILKPIATGDVEEVIRVRNQSMFAHSVQRLSVSDATEALKRVKSFINGAEAKTVAGARWSNLLAESFVIDWKNLAQKVFAGLIA